ncbi:hypothetical protein BDR05DRAFT_946107 [Suillus weaverae]|nr:hypothetical protein BDR05DRAFT_946107 [Suillus weaverae]
MIDAPFLTLYPEAMPSKKTKAGLGRSKKGSKQPAPETESQDDNLSQALAIAIAAINATKEIVPISLAKGILGTVANILTIAQSVIKNKSDSQMIFDRCENIREILESATKEATEDDLRGYLGHALTQLNKMLAPIRHYVRDSLQAPNSTCLQEIRTFYYRTVDSCSEEHDQYVDIINSDHLNIEQVVAFNLANIPDDAEKTYDACGRFLWCLEKHLPRPTTLTPAISNIIENSSTWALKANCLSALAMLYYTLSQLVEASQAFQAAEVLYLTAGDPESMGDCLITRADLLRCQGRFIQSQNLLENFQHSDSWESLSETTKARAWVFLDTARMYTFTASADELFVKSTEDCVWGLDSKIWHWRAKFHYGGDAVQVNTRLEDLYLQCTSIGDVFDRRDVLEGLAEIAFCEGRLSDAMNNLQTVIGIFEGQHSEDVLWYTVRKAVVASKQGSCDLARELIQKGSEPFQFFSLRNARVFVHRSYGSACIELTAGECNIAESYFTATIEACDMQGNLVLKAFSIRGLGEIAFARSNFVLATQRFKETQTLCAEMGVPPQHLYSCFLLDTLPDKFKGWSLFLEGLSPFANDTT